MPVYEYICNECEFNIEKIQKMGEEAPDCPKCGGAMRRKFSPPAILVMKNEGGYTIRSKGYKEGYKKEYLKSKGQEVWRDTIISPEPQAQEKS